jgi:hypothetical protein
LILLVKELVVYGGTLLSALLPILTIGLSGKEKSGVYGLS